MAGSLVDDLEFSAGSGDAIRFSPLDDGRGLRIFDAIERREYAVSTPASVTPEPVDPDCLGAPVDAAVRVCTNEITLPRWEVIFIHDKTGDSVTPVADADRSCPSNRYLLDISTQVKLYLGVESSVQISQASESTTIHFGGPTEVVVGARSLHRQPNGTITATDDLHDIRTAVSLLSSALKTTSPERSFPTLRGHPPRIEVGDEWSRPDHLTTPETGVTIEVHRSLQDLLVAAPLAFFLGAELAWGDRQLLTDDGFAYPLEAPEGFETGVERALKQTFVLDCFSRTEGLHPVDLDEHRTFKSRTNGGLDFADLYESPLGRRLEQYLEVPYHTIADLVPGWSGTAYVQPDTKTITALPYLLDTLSTIRITGPRSLEESDGSPPPEPAGDRRGTRSAELTSRPDDTGPHLVLPQTESAVTSTWFGDGIPIGAAKALAAGFEHRLKREPKNDDIRIQVVCNEPAMGKERDTVRDVYRARSDLPFDVDVRTDLSTGELESVLDQEIDFFHFIGHIDRRGFRCRDGWLDAAARQEAAGCDVFLLNTCRSYEQGEALVRQGSIAGIATVTDLLNHHAAAIGRTLARFLHYGFPLYAAIEVVHETHRFGDAYALLGDPHMVLSQPTTTFPEYLELRSRTEESVTVTHHTFPTHRAGVGSEICLPYEDGDRYYLFGGEIATVELDVDELSSVLDQPTPLRDGADLRFSVVPPNEGAI